MTTNPQARRKSVMTNADFLKMQEEISNLVSRETILAKAHETAREIEQLTRGKRWGIGWSGGKDSLALAYCAGLVSKARNTVTRGVLGMSQGLEYFRFEREMQRMKPQGIDLVRSPQDLHFVRANPNMLFPTEGRYITRWYQIKHIWCQEQWCKNNSMEMMLLGRRRAEGNYIGTGPCGTHVKDGVTLYCPLRHWSHADVLALLYYERIALPEVYSWPDGFLYGPGSWAATPFPNHGVNSWQYVFDRDPDVVRNAATVLPSAREFLAQHQGTFAPEEGER